MNHSKVAVTNHVSLATLMSAAWHRHHIVGICMTPGDEEQTDCIAITTGSEAEFERTGSPGHILALIPVDDQEIAEGIADAVAELPSHLIALDAIRSLCEEQIASNPLALSILAKLGAWTRRHGELACAEGWDVFDAEGEMQIQRLDDPEDRDPPFPDDGAAWKHITGKAREGSALHLLALALVSEDERSRIREACGDWTPTPTSAR